MVNENVFSMKYITYIGALIGLGIGVVKSIWHTNKVSFQKM